MLQQRSAHRTSLLAEQLQHALNSRVVIEQAKGVLAERDQVGMEVAFARFASTPAITIDRALKSREIAIRRIRSIRVVG